MTLQTSRDEVLTETLSARREDTFERTLGRIVRRHGGDYSDYLAIVTEAREHERARKMSLREAARALLIPR